MNADVLAGGPSVLDSGAVDDGSDVELDILERQVQDSSARGEGVAEGDEGRKEVVERVVLGVLVLVVILALVCGSAMGRREM